MHQLCSKARLCKFSGTRVERDFVEAPSQMLENWCWQKEALDKMSRHYETGAPIPDALLGALLAAKNANAGVLNMRQIVLGTFDQVRKPVHAVVCSSTTVPVCSRTAPAHL
jgi:thimet oligopeptidase